MQLRAEGELLVAGVHCTRCDRFWPVAEGNLIPFCCRSPVDNMPVVLRLEHRTASEAFPRPHPPTDLEPLDFFEKAGR